MQDEQTEVVEVVETATEQSEQIVEVVELTQEEQEAKLSQMEKTTEETLNRLKELEEQNSVLSKQIEADLVAKQQEEFNTALESANLESFKGIENLSNLSSDKQVEFIQNAVNQVLLQHSYQPQDVAQQSAYDEAMQIGDINKAIGFKFNKFFGKKQ